MVAQEEDDKAVYDLLIAPLEGRMIRTIWRIVRDGPLAEDTLQEALVIIWQKRDQIRRHPNPTACILKICLNCACDTWRNRQRQSRFQESVRHLPPPQENSPAATRQLEQEQLMTEVMSAMGCLPAKQAQAVFLRLVEEKSYEDIARTIGCNEITARIHFSRGRKKLMHRLIHLRKPCLEECQYG